MTHSGPAAPLTSTTPALTPPQESLKWTHTPTAVLTRTKDAIAATRAVHDRIAALPPASRSVASVIHPLAAAAAALETCVEPLAFYQHVAPDKALRDAGNEAEGLRKEFQVDASMRADVFEAVCGAAEAAERDGVQLDAEEKRLVVKMLLDGKRAGLALPEVERKELMEVRACLRTSVEYMR